MRTLRLTLTGTVMLALFAGVSGTLVAQGESDASQLARWHWANTELAAELEAMDCSELTEELDSRALGVLTHMRPDWLSPEQRYDWSDSVAEFGSDYTLHLLQARLALAAVIGLEKHCYGADLWGDTAAAAQDDLNASALVRSHWAVDAEWASETGDRDCDELDEGLDAGAWSLLSLTHADWLSSESQQDWSGLSQEEASSFVTGRLALFAIVGLEKGCYPPTMS